MQHNNYYYSLAHPQQSLDITSKLNVSFPYFIGKDPGSRWLLIRSNLIRLKYSIENGNCNLKSSSTTTLLKYVLSKYNPLFKKCDVNCLLLVKCLTEIPDAEFIIQNIIQSAIKLPTLVQIPMPFLRSGRNLTIEMTKEQAKSILANAFFCTFPTDNRNSVQSSSWRQNYSNINFNRLFTDEALKAASPNHFHHKTTSNDINSSKIEKLKCILNYFRENNREQNSSTKLLQFERRHLSNYEIPSWLLSTKHLCNVNFDKQGKIEDYPNALQVDFANKYIGGGILGNGAVMEEIKFATCPELIISLLFTEKLSDNEVLFISGIEQFSNYKGYGHSFKYNGPNNNTNRIPLNIVAMDALKFNKDNSWEQYLMVNIQRELNKCYCAFMDRDSQKEINPNIIATGCWGCGAFNGDPQLKFLIQWITATEANKSLTMCFFGQNDETTQSIIELYNYFTEKRFNVNQLYKILEIYATRISSTRKIPKSLLEDIQNNRTCLELIGNWVGSNFNGSSEAASHPIINPGKILGHTETNPGVQQNLENTDYSMNSNGKRIKHVRQSLTGYDKYDYKKQKRISGNNSVNNTDSGISESEGRSYNRTNYTRNDPLSNNCNCCSVQ